MMKKNKVNLMNLFELGDVKLTLSDWTRKSSGIAR